MNLEMAYQRQKAAADRRSSSFGRALDGQPAFYVDLASTDVLWQINTVLYNLCNREQLQSFVP